MGAYFIELGRLDEALEALNKARSFSQRARCDYGVICDDLYVADIDGLSGRSSKAIEVVERRMPELLKYESIDLFCLEIAARQHRLAGRMRASHRYIGEGLKRAVRFPTYLAMLLQERARLALAEGKGHDERIFRERANRLFMSNGLTKRHRSFTVREYGEQFKITAKD